MPKFASSDETFARTRKNRNRRLDADDLAYEAEEHDYYRAFFADEDDTEPETADVDGPPEGDRWSTWDQSEPLERGPLPHPDWLVTELAAVDHELGVLKTGKEADVYLIERAVPGTDRRCLLAAKRYRDSKHRMFHRDSGYLEGRQHRESRVSRAMNKRSAFGMQVIAGQWANAEFTALRRMYEAGAVVPYPVQIVGTEILMEFVGEPDGTAAPRLAQLRPEPDERDDLWEQLCRTLSLMARDGTAHGDLSAYNVIVHEGRLVVIDVPQIIDVVGNPRGRFFLERDVHNIGAWFVARGMPGEHVDALVEDLCAEARIR